VDAGIFGVFLVCAAWVGCERQTSAGSPTVVTFWAMGAEGERAQVLAREFEKEHPDIRLVIQTIPWSAAHEKLITAVAGGSAPDLCQLGNTWMPEFHAMKALAPLDSFIATSRVVKPENYFQGSWETNVIGGKTYGVPWYVETRVLFYRSDLLREAGFKRPPESWQELFAAAKALTRDLDGDGKTDRYGISLPSSADVWQPWLPFVWSNGGDLLEPDQCTPAVTRPEVREAWQFYVSFFRHGLAPLESGMLISVYQAFESGYHSMFIGGPWMITQLRDHLPQLEGRWNLTRLPKRKGQYSLAGGCNLVIFRPSKVKEAAWRFIEFLSRPEVQVRWYKTLSDLPAVKSAWQDSSLARDPMFEVFYHQLSATRPTPKVPEWEQIAGRLNHWMEASAYGKKTVDEAVRGLSADIERIMRIGKSKHLARRN